MAAKQGDSYEVIVLVVLRNIVTGEFLELPLFGHGYCQRFKGGAEREGNCAL